jgi:hypothetical protein
VADRIEHYDVVAAPDQPLPMSTTTAVTFPPGTITAIQVHIPGGHRGQTGFQLWYGSSPVAPKNPDRYLKGNKKHFRFVLTDPFPGGDGWFTTVYNAGKYAHTFQLTLEIDDVSLAAGLNPPVILVPFGGEAPFEEEAPAGGGVPAPGSGGGGSIGGPVQT